MTTSSFKGIVKPGEAKVETFSFPAQWPSPVRKVKRDESEAEKAPPPDSELPRTETYAVFSDSEEILEEAKAKARKILEDADTQAKEIAAKARETAEQIKKESASRGWEDGYRKGYEEGRQESTKKAADLLNQQKETFRGSLEKALHSIDEAKERSLEKYLDELKECALAVAEKVICVSLKSSGQIIKRMLIAETEKLKRTEWVKIYMEKTNYNMMMEADAGVVNELARLSDNIKFVVMNKEGNGSCIIEMPEEIVDISVDTQMDNIRELLENIKI